MDLCTNSLCVNIHNLAKSTIFGESYVNGRAMAYTRTCCTENTRNFTMFLKTSMWSVP